MKPVGSHNTDAGYWSTFQAKCSQIVNMVSDEKSFYWGTVNYKAIDAIAQALVKRCFKHSPVSRSSQQPSRQQMHH